MRFEFEKFAAQTGNRPGEVNGRMAQNSTLRNRLTTERGGEIDRRFDVEFLRLHQKPFPLRTRFIKPQTANPNPPCFNQFRRIDPHPQPRIFFLQPTLSHLTQRLAAPLPIEQRPDRKRQKHQRRKPAKNGMLLLFVQR